MSNYYVVQNPVVFGRTNNSKVVHVIGKNGKPMCGRKMGKIITIGNVLKEHADYGSNRKICSECNQKAHEIMMVMTPDSRDFPHWEFEKMPPKELAKIVYFLRGKLCTSQGDVRYLREREDELKKRVDSRDATIKTLKETHINEMNALKARMFDKYIDVEDKDEDDKYICDLKPTCFWGSIRSRRCRGKEEGK